MCKRDVILSVDSLIRFKTHSATDRRRTYQMNVLQKVSRDTTTTNGLHTFQGTLGLLVFVDIKGTHGHPSQGIEAVFVSTTQTDQQTVAI